MATRFSPGLSGQGKGISVCTRTGGSRIVDTMKLGPDGENWDVLDARDVSELAQTIKSFRHAPKGAIDHLCAGKGTWAFQVFTSSSPLGVVFLHIRPPKKLVEVMGSDPNVLSFTGTELMEGYTYAETGSRSPRVWRRNVEGWDEIAINFCLKKT